MGQHRIMKTKTTPNDQQVLSLVDSIYRTTMEPTAIEINTRENTIAIWRLPHEIDGLLASYNFHT